MKIEEFSARYSGPGVDDHSMDVALLGPALLSLGEVHRAAFRAVLPHDEHVPRVKVEQVRAGSFEVVLSIDVGLVEYAKQMFTVQSVNLAAGVATVTGFSLKDVVAAGINAVKAKASGRKKTRDELRVELGSDELAVVVLRLQDDKRFVAGVKGISSPMVKGDVESLELGAGGVGPVVIDQDDAAAIDELSTESVSEVRLESVVVEVDTPHIRAESRRKWRLFEKTFGTFTASMLDDDFLEQVHSGAVVFGNGMKFDATLRVEKWEQDGVLKRRFEVVKMNVRNDPNRGEQLSVDDV